MRAGGDVHPVLLVIGVKAVVAGPVVQGGVHLAKVPGVVDGGADQLDLGFGRGQTNVLLQEQGQLFIVRRIQKLQPVNHRVFMLYQRHRGPPFLPAPGAQTGIELGAHETDDYVFLCHIFWDKNLSYIL